MLRQQTHTNDDDYVPPMHPQRPSSKSISEKMEDLESRMQDLEINVYEVLKTIIAEIEKKAKNEEADSSEPIIDIVPEDQIEDVKSNKTSPITAPTSQFPVIDA